MRWSCRVCASTALMRTAALPQGRMVAQDLPAIDFGMWLRMAADGWEFAYLDETLGAYRIHGDTYSAEEFGPPQGPGYVQGIEVVSHLNAIKLQFLKQHNGAAEDARNLRRFAEEARRRELVIMARNLTLPERRMRPTFRALAEAVRADPGVLLEAPAWKLAAASLIGPRLTDRIKRLREAS
jgi:hypothetical protein